MPNLRALVVGGVTYTIGGSEPAVSITYSELVSKRNNSELVPGVQYRITDYVTKAIGYCDLTPAGLVGKIHWGKSAEHPFDVIVVADEVNKLNENARATFHDGDTYFSGLGENVEAWQLKYCLDNDTAQYAWADSTNGKGVIWWMKDEHDNEAGYDFKNLQFVRYALSLASSQSSYTPVDRGMVYNASSNPSRYGTPLHVYMSLRTGSYTNPFSIKWDGTTRQIWDYNFTAGSAIMNTKNASTIDSSYLSTYSADLYYTFDYYDGTQHVDASSSANLFNTGKGAHNNKINAEIDMFPCLESGDYSKKGIGFVCFQSNSTYSGGAANNVVERLCWGCTFGGNATNNEVGQKSFASLFGANCASNKLDEGCKLNSIGTSGQTNIFYLDAAHNVIGTGCDSNEFEQDCDENYILNSCDSNKFGQSCTKNILNNGCSQNIFGPACVSNTLAINCILCAFSGGCLNNQFSGQGLTAAAVGVCRGLNIQAQNINCFIIGDFVNNITVSASKITTTGRWALVSYSGVNDATSTTAVLVHQTGYNVQSAEQTTNGGQSWTPVS